MKRIISIFLASVMIISAVLCVDLSALATDVEVSNRAEWLSKLTQVYDMTVEEDNYPDNYFSDLSSESPYYRDIMVAAEFGLIDVEAGDPVNPDGDITREFAAQTLNYCAGWELEKGDDFSYSFADYESCAYPDDDQIAVDHNWIALDNGNFLPDQKVTAAEINTMLADAQETLKGDEVDENYESTFEYNDGVVEVPANTAVDFNDNEVVIHSTNYNIKENSTFVVYSNGIPVVYSAVKVTNNGDSLTVKTSEDVDEEAVEDIDMQETVDFNASDFVPAEGFEVVGSSSSYSKPGAKKANPSITLSFKKEFSDDKTFSFNVKLSDIKLSAKICTKDKSATVKATYKIDYDFEGKLEAFNINDYLPDSFGSVPFAGIGFVEFKPDISVSGKIKLGETFFAESGITVDGGGIHSISSFKKQRFSISLEVKLTIGVKVEIGVKILILKAGVYAKVGVTAKVTSTANVDTSGNYLHCLTLSAYLHFTLGAEVEIDFIAWKFNSKIEWKIFKESNSPIRLYFHFENGAQVPECTVGNSKYVTPSGTNYGSVSDTNAYTGSNAELKYSISGGEATITGYKGSPSKVVIPSKINGYPVTSIGDYAFSRCESLTSITIPNSVKSIGDYAFRYCTSLTSITIPNSVTSIGWCAFSDCENLTSITIPNSVTSIGYSAFRYCKGLTSIVVDSNNKYYDSRNNCNAIIETSTNELIAGCKNTVIPNSVTSIGEYAFYGCTSLTSITIPNSVTSIGYSAFEGCTSLTSITIPNSVTSIGSYAFDGCTSLTSITIPNSVTSIGYSAFYNCYTLTSITIPNSVKSIGECAFEYCESLTSITIPNSLTSIGYNAFAHCASLTSITIPNSVTSIGYSAFESCTSLTSITIPNSVTSIGNYAFRYCTSITSIVVDSNNKYYDSRNNCNAIIKTSTNTLIAGCKNTVIPNSVTSIGHSAFKKCESLTSITIPNSVTSIGSDAFYGCESLTSVTIGNSVTSIGYSAFKSCTSLISITIPDRVTRIGDYAFDGCTSLTDVYYNGTKEQWNAITIRSYNSYLTNATIHCIDGLINCKHKYSTVVTPPTCTAKGYTTHTCSVCGNSYVDTYVNALGHNWGAWSVTTAEVPATCTTSGKTAIETRICANDASHTKTRGGNVIVALGHDWGAWSVTTAEVPATCTTAGKTAIETRICANDASHTETRGGDVIVALGHKSDNGTVTKAATITETGVKTYKCTVCGKVIKTETLAKLPKKANTLVAKGKTATVKFAKLKKKNQTVTQKNAFTITKAQGKVTYKKASGNGKITVNSAGKFTVKKGLKKGTYKIKVKVTAAGNTTYKAVTKTVTVTIKVK